MGGRTEKAQRDDRGFVSLGKNGKIKKLKENGRGSCGATSIRKNSRATRWKTADNWLDRNPNTFKEYQPAF